MIIRPTRLVFPNLALVLIGQQNGFLTPISRVLACGAYSDQA